MHNSMFVVVSAETEPNQGISNASLMDNTATVTMPVSAFVNSVVVVVRVGCGLHVHTYSRPV